MDESPTIPTLEIIHKKTNLEMIESPVFANAAPDQQCRLATAAAHQWLEASDDFTPGGFESISGSYLYKRDPFTVSGVYISLGVTRAVYVFQKHADMKKAGVKIRPFIRKTPLAFSGLAFLRQLLPKRAKSTAFQVAAVMADSFALTVGVTFVLNLNFKLKKFNDEYVQYVLGAPRYASSVGERTHWILETYAPEALSKSKFNAELPRYELKTPLEWADRSFLSDKYKTFSYFILQDYARSYGSDIGFNGKHFFYLNDPHSKKYREELDEILLGLPYNKMLLLEVTALSLGEHIGKGRETYAFLNFPYIASVEKMMEWSAEGREWKKKIDEQATMADEGDGGVDGEMFAKWLGRFAMGKKEKKEGVAVEKAGKTTRRRTEARRDDDDEADTNDFSEYLARSVDGDKRGEREGGRERERRSEGGVKGGEQTGHVVSNARRRVEEARERKKKWMKDVVEK